MMVCGVLSALLVLSLAESWDRARRTLLVFTITATFLYYGHYIFFTRKMVNIPVTDTIYSFCNLAVFPLYLLYIEELTLRLPNRKKQVLFMLPSIVCCLIVGILYTLMSKQEVNDFIIHHLYNNEYSSLSGFAWWQGMAHLMAKIIFALQIPPVLILGIKHLRQYNQLIDNNYSNTEGKRLRPLQTLLTLLTITSIASFVSNIIGRSQFTESIWLLAIPSFIFSLLLLFIGHVGLHLQFYIQDIEQDDAETTQSPLSDNENNALLDKILKAVKDEKMFLQPNLKISDLAFHLGTNRNYVYEAIHTGLHMSFTDFINEQRIHYADKLMAEELDKPLGDIIIASGFTSTSAFYRNYKKFKGCTPTKNRI